MFLRVTSSSGQAPSQAILNQMVKTFERLVKDLMISLSNPVEIVEQYFLKTLNNPLRLDSFSATLNNLEWLVTLFYCFLSSLDKSHTTR